jgi:hypothetical protein
LSETQALETVPVTLPPVLQGAKNEEARIKAQQNALQRLFKLKPSVLELVSKSTQQEGAIPGQFRVTSTNEHLGKELKAVILIEPIEQRALYTKGEFSQDAKLCFSLDNFQPHAAAKDPKAMYCEVCPFGDSGWAKWREAKKNGATGDTLQALVPPCKKYWHLFIANRLTKVPYYFNVRGTSVSAFESAMQNVARLFQNIIEKTKADNRANPENQQPLPESVSDIIWKISFTMYSHQPEKGGQYQVGFKDFGVMPLEAQNEFGDMVKDFREHKAAGRVQTQVEAEQEIMEGELVETPATNEVETKNSQIQI